MLEGLGRTQQDLLHALLLQPAGMSIDDLAQTLAITRTAVRQHLTAWSSVALPGPPGAARSSCTS